MTQFCIGRRRGFACVLPSLPGIYTIPPIPPTHTYLLRYRSVRYNICDWRVEIGERNVAPGLDELRTPADTSRKEKKSCRDTRGWADKNKRKKKEEKGRGKKRDIT